MTYTTINRVKRFLNVAADDDDDIFVDKVEEAQAIIDELTLRTFEAGSAATRYFHAVNDIDTHGVLLLDTDLYSLTTVTNGDGENITTDCILLPANYTPKYGIKLQEEVWTYDDYPENAISVLGVWAYSATAPYAIRNAATRLAAYLYKVKQAPTMQTVAYAEGGTLIIPDAFPRDVMEIITGYARIPIGGR